MSRPFQFALGALIIWAATLYLFLNAYLDYQGSGSVHLLGQRFADNDALTVLALLGVIAIVALAIALQQFIRHIRPSHGRE